MGLTKRILDDLTILDNHEPPYRQQDPYRYISSMEFDLMSDIEITELFGDVWVEWKQNKNVQYEPIQ